MVESYAQWLERKMRERGFSQRSLAKAWRPTDVENARRAVRRYLGGMVPIARVKGELAEALGSYERGPSSDDKEAERK